MNESTVEQYVSELKSQLSSGHAKEHAYRPALQRLMRSFKDTEAINDPARGEFGAPDFVFQRESNRNLILGYAEAKDIVGNNLDNIEVSEQMQRYAGYQNLYLTDYLEFRFFRDGEKYETVRIGRVVNGSVEADPDQYLRLIFELQRFLNLTPQKITSGKQLALIMGAKTRRIRDEIIAFFDGEDSTQNYGLGKIYRLMRTMLVHDLDVPKFADMYAQTLVYGLFVARYDDPSPDRFDRTEARTLVPKSNPFLRNFFDHIVGPDFDERLAWAVDELCEVFRISNVKTLVQKHFDADEERDPTIHFYEDFLKAYDPEIRKKMGAYYTPKPIVKYIISKVDELLQSEFAINDGLADSSKFSVNHRSYLIDPETGRRTKKYKDERVEYHRVQLLDPAVGTATFLNETINFLYEQFEAQGQFGRWPTYAREHLVPRLSGFELMMAPYTIAHLKLGLTLRETGVDMASRRLGVYLTNTLEEGIPPQPDLLSLIGLAEAVTQESREAGLIKDERPVMVVIGNPPYSAISSNETPYANSLVANYKVEPGGRLRLNEQKTWLNDDYVKFIAFSERLITRNKSGIVAMITNNGYIDNPTFRGMRWHLARTFDKIYVLDLHGSSNKGEKAPGGGRDENVFQIQQGVSIIFAVRSAANENDFAEVHHAELWGTKKSKFRALKDGSVGFEKVDLDRKYFYFKPRPVVGKETYEQGIPVEQLFRNKVTGVVTMGDDFIVSFDPETIASRVKRLADGGYTLETLNNEFNLGKNYAPFVLRRDSDFRFDRSKVVPILYRPFDTRFTFFDKNVIWRRREEIMRNFIGHENIGLITTRMQKNHPGAFVTDSIIGHKAFNGYDSNSLFPLFIMDSDGNRYANLDESRVRELAAALSRRPTPIEVFDYSYGVLNSPDYLERFGEFMKDEFPRIAIPQSEAEFDAFRRAGAKLRALHLLGDGRADYITTFPVLGSNLVEKVDLDGNRLWINDTQYFGNVPCDTWEIVVGGFQPAQRWLLDRRGRTLSDPDLDHYQRIIAALEKTRAIRSDLRQVSTHWAEPLGDSE